MIVEFSYWIYAFLILVRFLIILVHDVYEKFLSDKIWPTTITDHWEREKGNTYTYTSTYYTMNLFLIILIIHLLN